MRKLSFMFMLLAGLCFTAVAKQKSKFKTVKYLTRISGSKTVAGIHNREPNASPSKWTDKVYEVSGKFPGLWSGDFLFQSENINDRSLMIEEALRQWRKGALVNIMWHSCNPAMAEPCGWDAKGVKSKLTDEQWTELTTEGTALNMKWKERIDEVSVYLKFLADKGVEVLWRPLHEMNQPSFWWGGRPGPEGTAKLYRMLYDYMTREKKLTNLVWVWDIQDFDTLEKDVKSYNPGDQYWDVAALDVYNDKSGYSRKKYDIMLSVCKGKPIAIGECQKLPTPEQIGQQPRWTFFMGWSELEFEKNSNEQIKALHNAGNIVTRDKMPGWKDCLSNILPRRLKDSKLHKVFLCEP